VYDIVNNLLSSNEFIDGPPRERAPVPHSLPVEPYRTKQAKTQTLLRVVYDMPRDKGEALAKFLKDHVEAGHIDVKTVESGLVVTADANIQRTIVGVVSLMLGEPITLDLGNVPPLGYSMPPPSYLPSGAPYVGTTAYVPAAISTQSPPQHGELPNAAIGRVYVPRTVVDPGTNTPRTVYEERVYDDKRQTDDYSPPRLTPPSAEEKREPTTTTKESPPRP
jgi:hypothetical protein